MPPIKTTKITDKAKAKSKKETIKKTKTTNNLFDKKWNYMYKQLITYKNKYGNCQVPTHYKMNNINDTTSSNNNNNKNYEYHLGNWVKHQRITYKNKTMSKYRIDQLTKIGFMFVGGVSRTIAWNDMYNELKAYKKNFGHCLVPITVEDSTGKKVKNYNNNNNKNKTNNNKTKTNNNNNNNNSTSTGGGKLGMWVRTQKLQYRKNELSIDRINQLNNLDGFEFDRLDNYTRCQINSNIANEISNKMWINMYKQLVQYKEKHGNTNLSGSNKKSLPDDEKKLINWVIRQRWLYKNNKLCVDRINKLKLINFDFLLNTKTTNYHYPNISWDDMFNKLVSYKQKYGNCLVPQSYKDNNNEDIIDVDVDVEEDVEAVDVDVEEGTTGATTPAATPTAEATLTTTPATTHTTNTNIISNTTTDDNNNKYPLLGYWVRRQRRAYKNKKLSIDQYNKLNSIGFMLELSTNQQIQRNRHDVKFDIMLHKYQQQKFQKQNLKQNLQQKQKSLMRKNQGQEQEQQQFDKVNEVNDNNKNNDNNDNNTIIIMGTRTTTTKNNNKVENGGGIEQQQHQQQGGQLQVHSIRRNNISSSDGNNHRTIESISSDDMELSIPLPPTDAAAVAVEEDQQQQQQQREEQQHSQEDNNGDNNSNNNKSNVNDNNNDKNELDLWIKTQTQLYKKHKLHNDRLYKLQSINFDFEQQNDNNNNSNEKKKWNIMFNQLIIYKEKYGNCLVPQKYKIDMNNSNNNSSSNTNTNTNTNTNVTTTTSNNNNNNNKTNIDVATTTKKSSSSSSSSLNSSLSSKSSSSSTLALGTWVMTQRKMYKNNKLSNEQINKLSSINFIFQSNRGRPSSKSKSTSPSTTKSSNVS